MNKITPLHLLRLAVLNHIMSILTLRGRKSAMAVCRHTTARACTGHALWSQMLCGTRKSREQDTAVEAPQP